MNNNNSATTNHEHLIARLTRSHEEITRQRDQLAKEKKELEQRYNSTLSNYDKAIKECNEIKSSYLRVQQQRDEYMKEMNEMVTTRLKTTKDLSRMTEERNQAVQEYNLIMSERDTVHKEIEKLQEELVETQKKCLILQDERRINLEQIDSLKREITTVLIERDRLAKECIELKDKYGDYYDLVSPPNSPFRSLSIGNSYWGSSSSGISSSKKQSGKSANSDLLKNMQISNSKNSIISNASYHQSKTVRPNESSLDSSPHEIDSLRRQNEQLQQELLHYQHMMQAAKKETEQAINERDKSVLERESMKTLCDRLRKERDRVVSDLAEALRDSDDMKRQRNEANRELKELKEKVDSAIEKSSSGDKSHPPSSSSLSSTISSPLHDCIHHTTTPTPTLLDRAYNKIFGDRKRSSHLNSCLEDERETLEEFDRVLNNYANKGGSKFGSKKLSKNSKSKSEKEKNGGTWPKYKGHQAVVAQNSTQVNAVTTLHPVRRKERKSLAIFNHLKKSSNNDKSIKSITEFDSTKYEPVSMLPLPPLIDNYVNHSPPTLISNSSSSKKSDQSENISSFLSFSSSHSQNVDPFKPIQSRDDKHYRHRSQVDSLDYSIVSAPAQDNKTLSEHYQNRSNKPRPHSVHDVLTDSLNQPLVSMENSNNHQQNFYDNYSISFESSAPLPSPRSSVSDNSPSTYGLGQLVTNRFSNTSPPSSQHTSGSSTLQHPFRYITNPSSSPLHSYTSRSGDSLPNGKSNKDNSTSHSRSMSIYQPRISNLVVKDNHTNQSNRYSISSSPSQSFSGELVPRSPLQSADMSSLYRSSTPHHQTHSLHICQPSVSTSYKNDESNKIFPLFDGLSTFPKRSQRIRIPSNNSVTSKSSVAKLSTGSIDKASSCGLSDRGSQLSFNVEWVNLHRKENENHFKPIPGVSREIKINRSTEQLGINISSGAKGVFVSFVELNSLASKAGMQVGDQILEVCGINMRNATFDHAANVLRQCGDRVNILVQYNPQNLKVLENSSYEEEEDDDIDEDVDEAEDDHNVNRSDSSHNDSSIA